MPLTVDCNVQFSGGFELRTNQRMGMNATSSDAEWETKFPRNTKGAR